MKTSNASLTLTRSTNVLDRLARRLTLAALNDLKHGRLRLHEGGESLYFGNERDDLVADVSVHDPAFYRTILTGGSIGAAEAYMNGYWETPDLTRVIRVLARNSAAKENMEGGLTRIVAILRKAAHLLKRNTRRGSRENIAAHYDLSNDFFGAWLDETMMYSAAIFPREDASLVEASRFKLDTICRKLRLAPEDHVIEIGTGWGGFAIHAAEHYGCRVTTTTISREQHDFAARRIAEKGLGDRITLLMKDYRDLEGRYDKLVSIEMIEAVGADFLETYFETCGRLLKPEGVMLIQAITMPDDRYEGALRSVDFIKRYIFPGCFIPSIGAMVSAMGKKTDLRLVHLEDQTEHYARTLELRRRNFTRALDSEALESFDETFRRMWTYYFCYCEGGFRERVIGSAQLVFEKPRYRGAPLLYSVSEARGV